MGRVYSSALNYRVFNFLIVTPAPEAGQRGLEKAAARKAEEFSLFSVSFALTPAASRKSIGVCNQRLCCFALRDETRRKKDNQLIAPTAARGRGIALVA